MAQSNMVIGVLVVIIVVLLAALALKGGGAPETVTQTVTQTATQTVTKTVTQAQTVAQTQTVVQTETVAQTQTVVQTQVQTETVVQKVEMTTPPDTLIIAMDTSDAVSLDPARAYEFTSVLVVNQLYDKLVDFEIPDLKNVVPEVAEAWEVSEDGKTWTFRIRQGITFPSGRPLTADDVVWSLQRVIELKQTASWVLTQFVSSPDQIRKIDDYTVEIEIDEPVAPGLFLASLTFTTSAILDKELVLQNEQDGDMGSAWLTDHSAGSGPYILERWTREQEIVLVANENYWRGAPPIKKIIIKHVPEPTDQMLLLKKGDVDIAWDLTVDQLEQLKDDPTIKIAKSEALFISYMGMNVGVEPLSKEEVRDAIRWCIDYDAIINDILRGGAIKWQTVIPKGLLGALDEQPYYKDVEKAKQLLAQAGYPDGFTITLTTPPTSPNIDIATKIQADLAECGINVQIQQMTASEMYEKYRKQGLELVLAAWGSDYPDPDNNAKAFGNYRVKQLAWRNMWYDDYAADLAEQAAKEFDPVKREQMYQELAGYILDKGPYAVLYQQLNQVAVKVWVRNFIPDPSFFLQDFSKVYKEE